MMVFTPRTINLVHGEIAILLLAAGAITSATQSFQVIGIIVLCYILVLFVTQPFAAQVTRQNNEFILTTWSKLLKSLSSHVSDGPKDGPKDESDGKPKPDEKGDGESKPETADKGTAVSVYTSVQTLKDLISEAIKEERLNYTKEL